MNQLYKYEFVKSLATCISEKDFEVQFFFDAVDLVQIVRGIDSFISLGGQFDLRRFNSDPCLVQSFASAGLLGGGIKILPTHQAEIFSFFQDRFGVPSQNKLQQEKKIKSFLNELHQDANFRKIELNKIDFKALQSTIKDWEKLFKAVQVFARYEWQDQLVHLFKHEQIFSITSYDAEQFIADDEDLFRVLKDTFEELRPLSTKSNFSDSLALTYLATSIRSFKAGKSARIPIFFDSQGTFTKVIQHSNLHSFFELEFGNTKGGSKKFSVIRDSTYFLVYGLLNLNGKVKNIDLFDKINPHHSKVYEFTVTLSGILGRLDHSDGEEFRENSIEEELRTFNESISKYVKYEYQEILVDHISRANFSGVLESLSGDFERYDQSRSQERTLAADVQRLQSNLESSYKIIKNAYQFWNDVKNQSERLRKYLIEIDGASFLPKFNAFETFSLMRYFIPLKYHESIESTFSDDGLLSDDPNRRASKLYFLMNQYFRCLTQKGAYQEGLFLIVSLILGLKVYPYIKELNVNQHKAHHSLLMMYGGCWSRSNSSAVKQKKSDVVVQNVINHITMKYGGKNVTESDKSEMAIALSYLYYNLWLQSGGQPFTHNFSSPLPDEYIVRSLEFANSAFNHSESTKDLALVLYSLNLLIFFTTELSTEGTFIQLERDGHVARFLSIRSNDFEQWHYRYDDTLARYYHRHSFMKNKNKLDARRALRFYREAFAKVVIKERSLSPDNDIMGYSVILEDYCSQLGIEV